MISVEKISQDVAEDLCRKITLDLPEYFGLPDINEHYAMGIRSRTNFAAKKEDTYLGLISIDFVYANNANIYWVGVFRDFQKQGIGHKLIEAAYKFSKENCATTLTVETLAPFESDENYLKTYHFYQSVGFLPLFNLKPQGYEWNMVYMIKPLEIECGFSAKPNISIRPFRASDIPIIVDAFQKANWPKPPSLFEQYLSEQVIDARLVWVAYLDNQFAAYVTLKWQSAYEAFVTACIPEIIDLNVLPPFRKHGVGSMLLDIAEKEAAAKCNIVGLGVGLYGGPDGGYGAAQRLYVKRGYIPDSKGVTYNYKSAEPGASYPLDDDLILWFTKKLK
ncbi:MAG TPA: GNAT family N-acetyltransferase [Gammaproteobacteria bacterium]|nr:GNAT family N-acetyltransferase [Gammaproteobacteria bacterium]